MTLPDADDPIARLRAVAARCPASPALTAPGRRAMTFGELALRIAAVERQLAGWGFGRGDVVAWPAIGRADTAAAIAIMPVSSTLAPLAPQLTTDAYESLLRRLKPKAVAVPGGIEHAIVGAARRLGIAELAVAADPAGSVGAFDLALARRQRTLDGAPTLPAQVGLVSATSGTTGRPKLVPHGQRQLVATARFIRERLALGCGDVSGHVAPMHLANGIRASHLLVLLNGGAVCCLPEADTGALLAAIERGEVTYSSASFTLCREILRRIEAGRRIEPGRLRFLRIASGRLDDEEIGRLERALGVPVVTGLASTETGFIAHQALPPVACSRGSVGTPLGCEIRLADADGRVAAPGESGEVQVRGPQVFDGYLDDDELNAQVFADGWFRMGDLGRFDAAGELHLIGRIKEIVNRGGEKISPAEVDAVLRTLPGVAEAAAFGIPHPRLGEELVAAVVRAPAGEVDAETLTAQLRARLPARHVPRQLWFVDRLPRNESGKLLRNALPDWVGRHGSGPSPSTTASGECPQSPVAIALSGLWASVLGQAGVAPDADFFMLGGDSLRGAQLLDQVLAVFGVDIPVDALYDDAATVVTMARRIEAERGQSPRRPRGPGIPHRASDVPVPMSSAQARAWFLQRLDPYSVAYHEARLWRIDGALDVEALRRALAFVAARQAMLRTRFTTVDGQPQQVIDAEPAVHLEVVDLRGADLQRLGQAAREHATRPFDLAAAPPIRWTVFALGPDRHALLRTWHHVLGDAASARVLQKEVSAAYAAARTGGDPVLPPLPVEYADYSIWLAGEQRGADAVDALDFWKERLADLPVLALPTDFRRPATQSYRGGAVTVRLPREHAAALKAVGRARGATPFVSFLAAFSALLSRLSGDADIAIGTPVSGRPLPEVADLIGFFANTLVFRADLAGAPTTDELLARTRERMREALLHQQIPFEQVVDALGGARDPSRNPLFQVSFAMRERDPVDLRLQGAEVRRVDAGMERAKFDLSLALIEGPDGIDACWEYCADLFARATIERVSEQYAQLVAAMARAPGVPVTTLPLMDPDARLRIVAAGLGASSATPADRSIPARFAEQARARPEAVAIGTLTYRELAAAANRLARELLARGVASGAIVAVARRQSVDVAIAWLAVLQAGAAYLPIDADLPARRIAFMLADAGVAHAIADEALAPAVALPGVAVIQPERDAGRLAAHPAEAPPIEVSPEAAAYVIYTSGSTGSPKGVVVPHRAVLRLVRGTDCAQLGPDDVVAQIANPAFDASTFEFWAALLNGARIVPWPGRPRSNRSRSPRRSPTTA
ncbi:MAG: AMP-binding protein [Betaproteobacteria bacterium]|nr:AMP-binding protein [Betaproteobacteria bacterium]